jgi:tripartite-type tricarboxylate transporter receptor subunit TctC
VTSIERIAAYPDIPTLSVLGYDVEGGASWFWLAGPSKLPADIVAKLNASVRKIVSSDRIREQFAKSALITMDLDQKATTAFIADEVKLWAAVAKENPLPKQP